VQALRSAVDTGGTFTDLVLEDGGGALRLYKASTTPDDPIDGVLDGSLEPTDPCGHVVLAPGEMMLSYSCGGGGYGDPRERDPARVVTDVAEGFVTPARAEAVYGVALDQDGQLDEARTRSLRAG
jgi:N-methylhydantoinase B